MILEVSVLFATEALLLSDLLSEQSQENTSTNSLKHVFHW